MSHRNDEIVRALCHEAEKTSRCVFPADKKTRQLLNRRCASQVVGEKSAGRGGRGRAECQPALVKPRAGMFARAGYWNALTRTGQALHVLRTLQRMHPTWVFCGPSAAIAHGLPVAHQEMSTVHLAIGCSSRTRTAGIQRHYLTPCNVVEVRGLRVTPLVRTAFDCARHMDFKHGLAIADATLRRLSWDASQLTEAFLAIDGRSTFKEYAVQAARHASPLSESAGESMARAAMIEQGFALPDLQVDIPRPLEPGRVFRVDFLWHLQGDRMVMGEFDGKAKYEDRRILRGASPIRALADEQHREAQLSLLGAPMLRMSFADIMSPARFVRLLEGYEIPREQVTVAHAHWDSRANVYFTFSTVLPPWEAPRRKARAQKGAQV